MGLTPPPVKKKIEGKMKNKICMSGKFCTLLSLRTGRKLIHTELFLFIAFSINTVWCLFLRKQPGSKQTGEAPSGFFMRLPH